MQLTQELLDNLVTQHRNLDETITKFYKEFSVNDQELNRMKRQKLYLKRKIERIKHEMEIE